MILVRNRLGVAISENVLNGQRFFVLGGGDFPDWKHYEAKWQVTFRAGSGRTLVVAPHGLEVPEWPDYLVPVAGVIHRNLVAKNTGKTTMQGYRPLCTVCRQHGKTYTRRNEPALFTWAARHRCPEGTY